MRIFCPRCKKEKVDVFRNKNKWCWWFEGKCRNCDFRYLLKDSEADYLQPDHPLFEKVYKTNPFKEYEKNKKEQIQNEQKRKTGLENKYYKMRKLGILKKHEEDFIKKAVLEEKDELWRK